MKLNLANYSMGFLKLVPPANVQLRGSGTLVRVGKISGVLTAAHVWQSIAKLPVVGIYLYPNRRRELQAIRESVDLLETVSFAGNFDDGLGPDLAFVRLTPSKTAEIEKYSTFLNMEKNEEKIRRGPPQGSKHLDAIAGGVEELGQEITMYGARKAVLQNALLNIGYAEPIANGRKEFDRLEFTPTPEPDYVLPKSYGGTSGGGCFRVYFETSDTEGEPVAFHLQGVAFYETKKDDKADKVLCHGPKSLNQKLLPAVRKKWKAQET